MIKRHAAPVNASLGVPGIDEDVAAAIGDAARRVEAGELDEQFPIDVYQTGFGHVDEHERQRGAGGARRPGARA